MTTPVYFTLIEGEPQLGGGGPAYKPQEDYYDEVIELKKVSIPVIIVKMDVMLIAQTNYQKVIQSYSGRSKSLVYINFIEISF